MDVMTYAQKAKAFWDAATQGGWFNPFDLNPTVRPPGTILISYPFGFGPDYRGYYFRSVFLPLLLMAGAVLVACYSPKATSGENWTAAALAAALTGAPFVFQFQLNDDLPASVFWGLTDSFLAGCAALAVASALRAVRERSLIWTAMAAAASVLSLTVKPSGLLVMALTGATWLLLAIAARKEMTTPKPWDRFFIWGLAIAGCICAAAVFASLNSKYFSAENIAYGRTALAIMKSEFTLLERLNWPLVRFVVKISVGFVLPLVCIAGFAICAFRRRFRIQGIAAAMCLGVGLWFWMVESGVELVRYFLPFAAMTFVALAPALASEFSRLPRLIHIGLVCLISAPALISTALLWHPSPSVSWQRALGINLYTDFYNGENGQAAALLDDLRRDNISTATMFMFDVTSPLRNVYGVIEYEYFVDATAPHIVMTQPRSWVHASAYNLTDILRSDYVAFEIVSNAQERDRLLSAPSVADFNAETRVLSAWFTTLTQDDGVVAVSETRVRILKVADREKFAAALARLRDSYEFSETFRAANAAFGQPDGT